MSSDNQGTTERNIAKYELQTALLDGLFMPVKKVKDGHLRLRQIEGWFPHTKETGETIQKAIYLRLRVPYLLGTGAESLLLAILKLTEKDGLTIQPSEPCLPLLLNPEDGAKLKDAGAAITTEYEFMKLAGMKGGGESYKLLKLYLEQMSEIRVHYDNRATGWRGSDWFLRYSSHDDGRLAVQVNWRLAGAIFGNYLRAHIDLDERYALQRDASKSLHRWLSAHIWEGKSGYLLYETLLKHTWPDEASGAAQRKRLERLKKEVLPDIASLPYWEIEASEKGATIIRKPRDVFTRKI